MATAAMKRWVRCLEPLVISCLNKPYFKEYGHYWKGYINILAALGVEWEAFIKHVITNPELENLLLDCSRIFYSINDYPKPKLSIL